MHKLILTLKEGDSDAKNYIQKEVEWAVIPRVDEFVEIAPHFARSSYLVESVIHRLSEGTIELKFEPLTSLVFNRLAESAQGWRPRFP